MILSIMINATTNFRLETNQEMSNKYFEIDDEEKVYKNKFNIYMLIKDHHENDGTTP